MKLLPDSDSARRHLALTVDRIGLTAVALLTVLVFFDGAPRYVIGALGAVAALMWVIGLLIINRLVLDLSAGRDDEDNPSYR